MRRSLCCWWWPLLAHIAVGIVQQVFLAAAGTSQTTVIDEHIRFMDEIVQKWKSEIEHNESLHQNPLPLMEQMVSDGYKMAENANIKLVLKLDDGTELAVVDQRTEATKSSERTIVEDNEQAFIDKITDAFVSSKKNSGAAKLVKQLKKFENEQTIVVGDFRGTLAQLATTAGQPKTQLYQLFDTTTQFLTIVSKQIEGVEKKSTKTDKGGGDTKGANTTAHAKRRARRRGEETKSPSIAIKEQVQTPTRKKSTKAAEGRKVSEDGQPKGNNPAKKAAQQGNNGDEVDVQQVYLDEFDQLLVVENAKQSIVGKALRDKKHPVLMPSDMLQLVIELLEPMLLRINPSAAALRGTSVTDATTGGQSRNAPAAASRGGRRRKRNVFGENWKRERVFYGLLLFGSLVCAYIVLLLLDFLCSAGQTVLELPFPLMIPEIRVFSLGFAIFLMSKAFNHEYYILLRRFIRHNLIDRH